MLLLSMEWSQVDRRVPYRLETHQKDDTSRQPSRLMRCATNVDITHAQALNLMEICLIVDVAASCVTNQQFGFRSIGTRGEAQLANQPLALVQVVQEPV